MSRPGHFRGVATIVAKLFNIVRPTRAYFGQKDAAQCVLIKRMVEDLNMDLDICIQPTIREADGLAMSSRNAYLTPDERHAAPIIYRSLSAAKDLYDEEQSKASTAASTTTTEMDASRLREIVMEGLRSEPLVDDIQYVSVDSKATMQPIHFVGVQGWESTAD